MVSDTRIKQLLLNIRSVQATKKEAEKRLDSVIDIARQTGDEANLACTAVDLDIALGKLLNHLKVELADLYIQQEEYNG
jgi:hypothetical protein